MWCAIVGTCHSVFEGWNQIPVPWNFRAQTVKARLLEVDATDFASVNHRTLPLSIPSRIYSNRACDRRITGCIARRMDRLGGGATRNGERVINAVRGSTKMDTAMSLLPKLGAPQAA